MEDHKSQPAPEPGQPAKRTAPLPLADRRRLVRQTDKPDTPAPVFNDWASI